MSKMDNNINIAPKEDTIPYEEYGFLKYVDINLWSSFYYQIFELLSITQKTDSILEVGKGTGVLGAVIKGLGFSYESMDINPNLQPDHIGSVDKMPFGDKSYDIIGCFEVIEHLPYDKFTDALFELFRVANKAVIISLPNAKRMIPFYVWVPKILRKKILIPFPFYNPDNHPTDPAHHWEINREAHHFRQIKDTMQEISNRYAFSFEREYRIWENPYHHLFVFYKK